MPGMEFLVYSKNGSTCFTECIDLGLDPNPIEVIGRVPTDFKLWAMDLAPFEHFVRLFHLLRKKESHPKYLDS